MNLKAKSLCMFALCFGSMMLAGCWTIYGITVFLVMGGPPTGRIEIGAKGAAYPMFVANAGITNLHVNQVDAWPMSKMVGEFESVTRITYLWGVAPRDMKKMVDNIVYGEVPPHYESNVEAPVLVPGVLYYCTMRVDKGDPRFGVDFWFYLYEDDLGKISIMRLTPVPQEWRPDKRAFLEVELVLDEETGKILKIVPWTARSK
ncbi:MAG: hypothetical protein ABIH04_03480 [Planctomycetota bacterium]